MSYIAHIGNPEINKSKNLYCDVQVQVTKTEYTRIRFIVKSGYLNAEKLRVIKTEEEEKGNCIIILKKVFKSDDISFFNMGLGHKYIFQNNILPFEPNSLTKVLKKLRITLVDVSMLVHVLNGYLM